MGNLVATGTKLADGRTETLSYTVSVAGQYSILVFNDPGSSGEYFLSTHIAPVLTNALHRLRCAGTTPGAGRVSPGGTILGYGTPAAHVGSSFGATGW